MTDSGTAQLLERRCGEAAIGEIHPHQLRHTAAHACQYRRRWGRGFGDASVWLDIQPDAQPLRRERRGGAGPG